jgi:hypothetical protein
MRSLVNRLVGHGCAIALMATLLLVSPTWAGPRDEERDREAGRFAVGFAITSGVLIAQQNGRVSTNVDITVPPPPFFTTTPPPGSGNFLPVESPSPFATPALDANNTVSPFLGVSLELMTPAIDIVPGAPRVFAAVEFLPTLASETTIALQGAATEFKLPDQPLNTFSVNAVSGTGTRLDGEVMTSTFAAHLGVAIPLEVRERIIRVKPSVGWIRWGVIAEGKVLDAYKNDPLPPGPLNAPFYGSNLRLVEIEGRGSGFFNAVGPGLEVELELGKRGSFRPVMFLSGFAYRTVGDDSIVFASQTTVDDLLGEATYGARWIFTADPWTYRAGLGFRLRWVGD